MEKDKTPLEVETDNKQECAREQTVPTMIALDWCLREMGAIC